MEALALGEEGVEVCYLGFKGLRLLVTCDLGITVGGGGGGGGWHAGVDWRCSYLGHCVFE